MVAPKDLNRLYPWLGALLGLTVLALLGILPTLKSPAPAFELEIAAGDGAGDRISLANFQGEVVVLEFWASWCGYCQDSVRDLNLLSDVYGDRVHFFTVNTEAESNLVLPRHQAFGWTFPTLHDPSGQIKRDYDVESLPTLVIIDREGQMQRFTGAGTAGDVRETLDSLLR